MYKTALFIILTLLAPKLLFAQLGDPNESHTRYSVVMVDGEEMFQMELSDVFVFPKTRRGRALQRKYKRMINAIRVTYPVAAAAKRKLYEMEDKLKTLNKKEQKAYVKSVEKELKEQYTPLLKQMSMYQGMILIKLIDRNTGNTSYELVKELRGSLSAFFWQGIARLFGGNLKAEYDPEGDDELLNKLVIMYERGQI